MGNNLIHNYLQNYQTEALPRSQKQGGRPSFSNAIDSTIDSFDRNTDKLIKPLDGKGHLVSDNPIYAPKEYIRDTVYTTKALADGVRGKANDHQLGKLNDLGLKIGGVAIATYLMTRKSTPKTKLMEFIGFGTFLASMKLWPKIALEIPARLVHGFNYRKQYIDDQGRKKEVGLDPNYMPFDLYRGEKKSEDLDVIGDRLGIRRDLPNRQEAVKDQMRKISVQNNTMWMLTAGIATPIMTALACNEAEKIITPIAEKHSNKNVNAAVDKVSNYLNGNITDEAARKNYEAKVLKLNASNNAPTATETLVNSLRGKEISKEQVSKLADTLAEGFNADMKDAAAQDIRKIIGGQKYITNQSTVSALSSQIHDVLVAGADEGILNAVTPEKVEKAVAQGTVRGAVRNMLTNVGFEVVDKAKNNPANSAVQDLLNNLSTNFKSKDVAQYDFFQVTKETEAMSPVDRLAHNIKSIVMKVNNENPSEDFISKMSELEGKNKGIKLNIDAKLQQEAERIAKSYYEGTLAIADGQHSYVSNAVTDMFKKEAPKSAKARTIFHKVKETLSGHIESKQAYVLTDSAADVITKASHSIDRYNAVDKILTDGIHFKVEKANETLVANNWEQVSNTLFKELGITDKDLKLASKNKKLANEVFAQKLEQACSNPESYKNLITKLGNIMVQLDEKMELPNQGSTGNMMSKLESGLDKNCRQAGSALDSLNFQEMKKTLVSSVHGDTGLDIGSILNAKKERLHSRVAGVQGSYMRLMQTCEFFHRASGYEQAIAELKAEGADLAQLARKLNIEVPEGSLNKDFLTVKIAEKFGLDANEEVSKEIIAKGKNLLLRAHTNQYYNKMGTSNNPMFFTKLMKSIFRPSEAAEWDRGWSESASKTFDILNNEVKASNGDTPLRAFEGRKGLGQKLKEYMNQSYNTLSSISRRIYEGHEPLRIAGTGVSPKDGRASAIFDLVGKTPSEFFFDSAKQKFNTRIWAKTFTPVLLATFAATVGAQFFFGKKDPEIKA